jgi:hypothetical protein
MAWSERVLTMSDTIPFGAATEFGLRILTAVSLLVSVMLWLRNARNYRAIARAIGPNGPAIPETLIAKWYGAVELTQFIEAAERAMTDNEVLALKRYRTPTLLWNDIGFAASFAAFLIFGNLAIAPPMALWSAYGSGLAIFCAAMGAVYGAADIGEDLTLERIFAAGRPVDRKMAFGASLLTHIKFAALFLAFAAVVGLFATGAYQLARSLLF